MSTEKQRLVLYDGIRRMHSELALIVMAGRKRTGARGVAAIHDGYSGRSNVSSGERGTRK